MRIDQHTDTRSSSAFPRTRHSVLLAARDADPETQRRALDVLIAAYRRPVYAYLRLRWRLERVALDLEAMEGEPARSGAVSPADAEALFDREWVRGIFTLAVDALRERLAAAGKRVHFELFRRYDLEGADAPDRPTYAQLAAEHGLPVTQVTNFLALARRESAAAAWARSTVCATRRSAAMWRSR